MHELAVTQNILEICLRHAKDAGAKQITRINLVIGEYASIVDDSVQFYWDFISDGTIAQGAQLHFTRINGEMVCVNCNQSFHPLDTIYICPNCQGNSVKISKGDEFRVESIDVE